MFVFTLQNYTFFSNLQYSLFILGELILQHPRHHPMAEAFAFVLALRDGNAERVFAWLQAAEVEIDGIGGRPRAPA